jgi:hypothetical protein
MGKKSADVGFWEIQNTCRYRYFFYMLCTYLSLPKWVWDIYIEYRPSTQLALLDRRRRVNRVSQNAAPWLYKEKTLSSIVGSTIRISIVLHDLYAQIRTYYQSHAVSKSSTWGFVATSTGWWMKISSIWTLAIPVRQIPNAAFKD